MKQKLTEIDFINRGTDVVMNVLSAFKVFIVALGIFSIAQTFYDVAQAHRAPLHMQFWMPVQVTALIAIAASIVVPTTKGIYNLTSSSIRKRNSKNEI